MTNDTTRIKYRWLAGYVCYISNIEPKNVSDALQDEYWTIAMQEELNQFQRLNIWTLMPIPQHANVIGTKWILRNKSDAQGEVVRNKACLVAQCYNQLYQIDVKSAFLNGTINEEVYVEQPKDSKTRPSRTMSIN
ncbi:hypothetical protein Scep_030404 [Stephania cephalantha]|uniref:Mitochondrial protein n=1 Tax=Stephania cephalantha TaxID=152367 RepID=A0AAP0E7B6_9MAGN